MTGGWVEVLPGVVDRSFEGLKAVVGLPTCLGRDLIPYGVVQRVQVRAIWRPSILQPKASLSELLFQESLNGGRGVRPKDRKVLFGPDKNLGEYLAKKTGREMKIWPGSCEVHVLFSAKKLMDLKSEHPDALVIAHPECEDSVLRLSDKIGSTSFLLNEVKSNPTKKFIVATEAGIFHEMKKQRPEAELIQAPAKGNCACNECPYMKMNTLANIRDALKTLDPEVKVDESLIERARVPLERMMKVTRGEQITWPEKFEW